MRRTEWAQINYKRLLDKKKHGDGEEDSVLIQLAQLQQKTDIRYP